MFTFIVAQNSRWFGGFENFLQFYFTIKTGVIQEKPRASLGSIAIFYIKKKSAALLPKITNFFATPTDFFFINFIFFEVI